jgi:glycosyltransferase involved in cell wall biosynthesis
LKRKLEAFSGLPLKVTPTPDACARTTPSASAQDTLRVRIRVVARRIVVKLIAPGIDLRTFRPRADVARRTDMVLALGRANPLKNLPLTVAAWNALRPAKDGERPELCLFGVEPELVQGDGMAAAASVRYVESPDDERVNELFCEATVFVQTSVHEGFALPPLEAMATGAAVVAQTRTATATSASTASTA